MQQKQSKFRSEGKLTDVIVRADGEDFEAHRCVIAAASDYVDALFASGMSDADANVVTLAGTLRFQGILIAVGVKRAPTASSQARAAVITALWAQFAMEAIWSWFPRTHSLVR